MQTRARAASGVGLTVVMLALAPAGSVYARIVPDERRIGKVKLGMSEEAVRKTLGRPDRIKRVRFDVRRLVYGDKKLRVDIYRKRSVVRLKTTNPRERTLSGVGVGSTRAELRRAEGDRLECEGTRREGACWIYPRKGPNDPTEFGIADGRTVSVLIYPGGAPL